MKRLLMFGLAALLCVPAFAAQQRNSHINPNGPAPVHNGLWWQEKSGLFKEAFIGGYKAGAEDTAGHALDVNKFAGSELIDGLNTFYKDFRNRNIMVSNALSYVEDQLSGSADEKLSAELLKMRAAAAPTRDE
jgi:hypothetical protein